mgnify:CR=1 FL=1
MIGLQIQNCTSSELAIITVPASIVPALNTVILYDGDCWEYVSSRPTNDNVYTSLTTYEDCEACLDLNTGTTQYSGVTFTNCCDSTDVLKFNIIPPKREAGAWMGKSKGALKPRFNWSKKAV